MSLPTKRKFAVILASILLTGVLSVAAIADSEERRGEPPVIPVTVVAPEVVEVVAVESSIQYEEAPVKEPVVEDIIVEESHQVPIEEEPNWDWINTKPESEEIAEVPALDRTKPLYNVFKNGCAVSVSTDLQWYIRDLCETYGFCEKYVYGMILLESTFQPTVSSGKCKGLAQIDSFWITKANIKHFTDNYSKRNLKDPYDNLLTMAEMWCYAKKTYGLDLSTTDGNMRLLYWHNTGNDPRYITSSSYFNTAKKYGNELVPLQ